MPFRMISLAFQNSCWVVHDKDSLLLYLPGTGPSLLFYEERVYLFFIDDGTLKLLLLFHVPVVLCALKQTSSTSVTNFHQRELVVRLAIHR